MRGLGLTDILFITIFGGFLFLVFVLRAVGG